MAWTWIFRTKNLLMKGLQQPYVYASGIDDDDASVREIVDVLAAIFKPQSVVDFGCGLGKFVTAFRDKGAQEVLGLDGAWAKSDALFSIRHPQDFREVDLTRIIRLEKKYDLALC